MPRKIYETPAEKRKDFWLGFIGWFVLNGILFGLSYLASTLLTNVTFPTDMTNVGDVIMGLYSLLGCLPLILNIGLMIFFAFTRAQIALGMLTAFGIMLFITVCLGILATVACFVLLGQGNL